MSTNDIHRGKFLEKKIKESKTSYVSIVEGTGIGRTTLYNYLKNPDLPIEKMLVITNFLRIDISDVFEVAKNVSDIEKVEKAINDNSSIGNKYLNLLEKYTEIQSQLMLVKEELAEYKTGTKSAQKHD